MVTEARKKKRVSKKRKIAWRKHVDITDINKFLDDQRLQERVIGKPFAERRDDELFTIDSKVDKKPLSKKEKRNILYEPKCFSMLKNQSQVPDPIVKRNVRTIQKRKHPLAIKKKQKKELIRAQIKKQLQENKKLKEKTPEDIWDIKDNSEIKKNGWLEKITARHVLINTGNMEKSVPISVQKKKSILPPVESPHPGISYNPSLKDHQALLRTIAEKEEKMIKEEEHLDKVTKKMFAKRTQEQDQRLWFKEMSEGLPINEPSKKKKKKNQESPDTDDEYHAINPPVKNKKKDIKKRKRLLELKKLEKEKAERKLEKKKISDIQRLKLVEKSIEKHQKKVAKLKEKRLKKQKLAELQPKRLSSTKFETPELEFNAGEDIPGNLRNIKVEGSLLMDRYKSLQKRNILEPTKIRMKKKKKVKKFIKPTHKIDEERPKKKIKK